eukprot:12024111-Alexandrium_andersonii.AAC.1
MYCSASALERAAGSASAAFRLYAAFGPPAVRQTLMFLIWKHSARRLIRASMFAALRRSNEQQA